MSDLNWRRLGFAAMCLSALSVIAFAATVLGAAQ